MEKATRVLQEREAERQKREAIEAAALADAMDVDDTPIPVQQNVQHVLNYFQQNYMLNDHRQTHFTTNQFIQFLAQNTYQVNAEVNAGRDPRSIMYQAVQDAQRGHQQGLAVDDEGVLHITPPGPARAPAAGVKPKPRARGQPKRRGRALMNAPVPAALAVAAAPSGAGTLLQWQKQNAVATPSATPSASAAADSTTRMSSGGATLVKPTKLKGLGRTSVAHAKAKAATKAAWKAAAMLADSDE